MTIPAISNVWSSACFATGEETETKRSGLGVRIVRKATPFSALPGVARPQASLTSS
jgi:hypothetical protein